MIIQKESLNIINFHFDEEKPLIIWAVMHRFYRAGLSAESIK